MKRRTFLKLIAGVSAMAIYSWKGSMDASQTSGGGRPLVSGRQTRVFLAGVDRGASVQAMKSAVCAAAEAATDFSWLSKGDSVFIKPALNSGNPYPATTNPIAIGAMVELLKEKGARRVIVGDMSGIEHVKLSPKGLTGSSRRLMEALAWPGLSRRLVGRSIFLKKPDGTPFMKMLQPAATGSVA